MSPKGSARGSARKPEQMSREEILAKKAALQQQLKDLEELVRIEQCVGVRAAGRDLIGAAVGLEVGTRRVGRGGSVEGGVGGRRRRSAPERAHLSDPRPPPTLSSHFGSARSGR